jgi:hypothetical protein
VIRFRALPTLARLIGPAVLGAAGLLLFAPTLRAGQAAAVAPATRPTIAWQPLGSGNDFRHRVVVTGLDPAELSRGVADNWTSAQWAQVLRVSLLDPSPTGTELPAMAGSYRIADGALVFEPAFPLNPDTRYNAVVHPGPNASSAPFRTRPRPAAPATTVSAVYPSTDVLPENLLKFYLHFSAPMNRGDIYKHIHLLDQDGKDVYLPFLELGEELWNPQMTRVTVFIDPGRIKRGVRELMEHGPALTVGHTQTLVIDAAWTDGNGKPLKESFRKTFRVAPADRTAIDPKLWKVTPAAAGTRNALTLAFPEPLDHALGERLLQVVALAGGTRRYVDVTATLSDHERRLALVPDQPWAPGNYELEIPMILEDLAGNKVGKVFDVDVFDEVQRTAVPDVVALPFSVQ